MTLAQSSYSLQSGFQNMVKLFLEANQLARVALLYNGLTRTQGGSLRACRCRKKSWSH